MNKGNSGLAQIKVRAEHVAHEGEIEHIAVTTMGRYARKRDALYIHYVEPADFELGDTRTTVRVSEQEVSIMRFGDVRVTQRFVSDGNVYTSVYETKQGNLSFDVTTRNLLVTEGEMHLSVAIDAELAFADYSAGFKMSLEVDFL